MREQYKWVKKNGKGRGGSPNSLKFSFLNKILTKGKERSQEKKTKKNRAAEHRQRDEML